MDLHIPEFRGLLLFAILGFCGVRPERVPPDGVRFLFGPSRKKRKKKSAHARFFRHVSMTADWNCNAKWRSKEGIVRSHVRSLAGDAKCEKTEVPNFVQKSEFS